MPPHPADLYDLVVFDLDGTLVDSAEDLAASVNHVLVAAGRTPLDLQTVLRHVGNGARRLLERSLRNAAADICLESALERFLEHYTANCLVRSRLYPGVLAALEGLRDRSLAVLTNKPLVPSRKILAGLGIDRFFARIEGGDSAPHRKPHPAGLLRLVDELGASPERTLLVGDTAVDAETARAAATGFAGVTYGFRPEELQDDPAALRLDSLEDLCHGAGAPFPGETKA